MGTLRLNTVAVADSGGIATPTARLRWWKPKTRDPRGRYILQQMYTVSTMTGTHTEWREIEVMEE